MGGQLDDLLASLAVSCLFAVFALLYFIFFCTVTNKYDLLTSAFNIYIHLLFTVNNIYACS